MSANYDATMGGSSSSNAGRSLSEQSGKVLHEMHELGRVAKTSAGELATSLREKSEAALDAGRERAKVAKADLEESIRENPLKAVLIAAGVGVVLGWALHRR